MANKLAYTELSTRKCKECGRPLKKRLVEEHNVTTCYACGYKLHGKAATRKLQTIKNRARTAQTDWVPQNMKKGGAGGPKVLAGK